MSLPRAVRELAERMLADLDACGTLDPRGRVELYRAFGPSAVPSQEARFAETPPILTAADRARAQEARFAAVKVLQLLPLAFQETSAHHGIPIEELYAPSGEDDEDDEPPFSVDQYVQLREFSPIEHIDIYRVPGLKFSEHLLKMGM